MSDKSIATITTMGIDTGKNLVPRRRPRPTQRDVVRQEWSRGQIEARLAAMSPSLMGMETGVVKGFDRRLH